MVDVDANSDTTQAAGIEAMPTFQVFWGGEKVDTIRGANEQALRESIQKNSVRDWAEWKGKVSVYLYSW